MFAVRERVSADTARFARMGSGASAHHRGLRRRVVASAALATARGAVCDHDWRVAQAGWFGVAEGPSRPDYPGRFCERCGAAEISLIEDED